ncbi:MAG: M1 family metallopeptidase, partial [Vicinamibacterales bacterium]
MPAMLRPAILALAVLLSAPASPGCRDAPDMSPRNAPAADPPDGRTMPAAGVPRALAEERVRRVSDVRYELHFTIPGVREEPVSGTATLRFRLADSSRPLALDFAGPAQSVRAVRVQDTAIEPTVRDEHILLPPASLREGENEITLAFDSSDLALNRSPEFMYTLFVPARARLAFPCFDQPDIKARYTLSLDVPKGWEAIANGAETARHERAGRVSVAFAETAPLPTYLAAFAAGRFSVESA